MLSAVVHLMPYALVAAVSPLGFAATLAVIASGRLKALGFAIGFVGGQVLACALLVRIGAATVTAPGSEHAVFRAVLQLGLGLALLCLAALVHRRPEVTRTGSSDRSQAALTRLGRLRVTTAATAGLLLGFGGPKRLVLAALASSSIISSAAQGANETILIGWYVTLATALVWAPVLACELFGEIAVARLDAAQQWLSRHQRQATLYPLLILGLLLVVGGITSL
jgi:hypothetical protein